MAGQPLASDLGTLGKEQGKEQEQELAKQLDKGGDDAGGAVEGDLDKMAVSSVHSCEDALAHSQESCFAKYRDELNEEVLRRNMLRAQVLEGKMKELKKKNMGKELLDQLSEKGLSFLRTGKEKPLQEIEQEFGFETKQIHAKCGTKTLQGWLAFLKLLVMGMDLEYALTGKVTKELVYKCVQYLENAKCSDQQLEQASLVQKLTALLSKEGWQEDCQALMKEFKQLSQVMLCKVEEEIFMQFSLKVAANLTEEIGFKLKKAEYGSFQILGGGMESWGDYLKSTPNKYTAEEIALMKNCKGKLLMMDARRTFEALGIQEFLEHASCFKLNDNLGSSFATDVMAGLRNESMGKHCKKPNESCGKVKGSLKILDALKTTCEKGQLDSDLEGAYVDTGSIYAGGEGAAGQGSNKALAGIYLTCSKELLVQLGHLQHEVLGVKWSNQELAQLLQKIQEVGSYHERRFMDTVMKRSCFDRTALHGFDDHQEGCHPQIIRDKLLQRLPVKQREAMASMTFPLCMSFLQKFVCGKSLAWEDTVKEFEMVLKKPWPVQDHKKFLILKELALKDPDLHKQLEKAQKEAKDSSAKKLLSHAAEAETEVGEVPEEKADKCCYKDTQELKVVLTQLERVKYYWRGKDALKELEWVKKQPYTKGAGEW